MMSAREINAILLRDRHGVYCRVHEMNTTNFRVYRARTRKGVLEVRVMFEGRDRWFSPVEVWEAK